MGMKQDLSRLREIGAAVVRHGFGHHLGKVRIFERLGFKAGDKRAPDEENAAHRFARLLEDLGPTFVKLGQILSTRPDSLPPFFIAELSRLQDKVPPLPYSEIKRAVEQGLPGQLDDHFASIDEVPIASASVAQVHAARLLDGTEVVVKAQRPGIGAQMATDADLIRKVAQVFELMFEEVGSYGPVAVVEEWQKGLALELDFEHEARTIDAFFQVNRDRADVKIPRLYGEHSSRTVLTMERLRGRRLAEISDIDERRRVAERLIQSAFEQVFEDGLFHADPHPGNFLVMEDGALAILDFGLAGRISKDSQDRLIALALAIAVNDADTVTRLIYRIGCPEERIRLSAFRAATRGILERYLGLRLEQVRTPELASELFELMGQYRLRIPKEYALLAKATVTFEGVIRDVYPDLDIQGTVVPYAERLLAERYDPRQLKGGSLRIMLQIAGFVQELPLQLSQALLDFESGHTTVRVEGAALHSIARGLRAIGVALLSTAVALIAIFTGVYSIPYTSSRPLGLPIGLVLGLGVAIFSIVGGSAYVLRGGRFPRMRLSRLRRAAQRSREARSNFTQR